MCSKKFPMVKDNITSNLPHEKYAFCTLYYSYYSLKSNITSYIMPISCLEKTKCLRSMANQRMKYEKNSNKNDDQTYFMVTTWP